MSLWKKYGVGDLSEKIVAKIYLNSENIVAFLQDMKNIHQQIWLRNWESIFLLMRQYTLWECIKMSTNYLWYDILSFSLYVFEFCWNNIQALFYLYFILTVKKICHRHKQMRIKCHQTKASSTFSTKWNVIQYLIVCLILSVI